MALSNSQYNALMREYEQQQRKDRVERDARVQEVYRRIPQIEKLDQEIAGSGAECARMALHGDPNARETLRRKLSDLREQKQILLTAGGYPAENSRQGTGAVLCPWLRRGQRRPDRGGRGDQGPFALQPFSQQARHL